jgi:integrase
LTHEFSTLIKGIDITQITLHGLRHTHITHLLMDNVPIKVVSERAGHSSVTITLDTYGHVLPDMQKSVAELIDKRLQAALAK